MNVLKLKTKDFYPTMLEWWDKHKFNPVAFDNLPEHTYVAFNEDVPVYSCCLYRTDSNLCWIAWQISNKGVPRELKEGALEFLFEEMEKDIKAQGYNLIFTTSHTEKVENALIDSNYIIGDTGVNHYLKVI